MCLCIATRDAGASRRSSARRCKASSRMRCHALRIELGVVARALGIDAELRAGKARQADRRRFFTMKNTLVLSHALSLFHSLSFSHSLSPSLSPLSALVLAVTQHHTRASASYECMRATVYGRHTPAMCPWVVCVCIRVSAPVGDIHGPCVRMQTRVYADTRLCIHTHTTRLGRVAYGLK